MSTTSSQIYAHILKMVVVQNTPMSAIFLGSSPTAIMHTPDITNKLKAADPTIVEGPSSPGFPPRF